MNIFEAYEFVQFIANKEQGGFITVDEFNLSMRVANMEFFNDRYGQPSTHQPGRPVATISYPQTQKVHDDLRTLVTDIPISNGDTLPTDYLHLISLSNPRTVTFVDHELFSACTEDSFLLNGLNFATFADSNTFLTNAVGSVDMFYLRSPQVPFLAVFTDPTTGAFLDANGVTSLNPVYWPAASVEIEFPEQTHNEIIYRAIAHHGMNLNDAQLNSYAESKQTQTPGV
jgi:hypothetical protein